MVNVYVIGVFDLFHTGHVELLRRSKELGDRLIIAVNGDDMVSQYKRQPYMSEEDRLTIIKSCRYVDDAFIIKKFDNKQALIDHKIAKIVHGDDWDRASYLEQIRVDQKFLEDNNIEMVFLPYTEGISTGELIQRIKEN